MVTSTISPALKHDNPVDYKHVKSGEAKKAEKIAVRAPGVQSIGYIPGTKTLQVYFTKSATVTERATAGQVVDQILHPNGPSAPSKKHTHKHKKHH